MRFLRELRCPACGKPPLSFVVPPLLAAMELQAKQQGVDIECRRCGHRFRHQAAAKEAGEADAG